MQTPSNSIYHRVVSCHRCRTYRWELYCSLSVIWPIGYKNAAIWPPDKLENISIVPPFWPKFYLWCSLHTRKIQRSSLSSLHSVLQSDRLPFAVTVWQTKRFLLSRSKFILVDLLRGNALYKYEKSWWIIRKNIYLARPDKHLSHLK